jgi:sn-2 palmitoyl-lipid 9-desaturase
MCTTPTSKREALAEQERLIFNSVDPSRLTWKRLDWGVFAWMTGMHIGALLAPIYFSWSAVAAALVLHWLTASVGICLGFHRYLSHRSFKLKTPAKFGVLLAGSLSAEGGPSRWAAIHRLHHAKSDKEGDPHSPRVSGMWAHLYWMFIEKCHKGDQAVVDKFGPDLTQDPMVRFFDKTFVLWSLGLGAVLYAIGGLPWLVWGLFVRTVCTYHSTWFVNSATHLWGYRNYETRDDSRNNWWVALLAYGEGWHNNHHAHPSVAPAGHRWWEIDMTMWSIRFLQLIGQAYDVKDRIPHPKVREAALDENHEMPKEAQVALSA